MMKPRKSKNFYITNLCLHKLYRPLRRASLKDLIMYELVRKERYNHRTTPEILWRVVNTEKNWIVAECKTKKEALRWLAIYTK